MIDTLSVEVGIAIIYFHNDGLVNLAMVCFRKR